jgi:hypothetical protein
MVGGRNSIDRLEAMKGRVGCVTEREATKGRVGDNQAEGVEVSLRAVAQHD